MKFDYDTVVKWSFSHLRFFVIPSTYLEETGVINHFSWEWDSELLFMYSIMLFLPIDFPLNLLIFIKKQHKYTYKTKNIRNYEGFIVNSIKKTIIITK